MSMHCVSSPGFPLFPSLCWPYDSPYDSPAISRELERLRRLERQVAMEREAERIRERLRRQGVSEETIRGKVWMVPAIIHTPRVYRVPVVPVNPNCGVTLDRVLGAIK